MKHYYKLAYNSFKNYGISVVTKRLWKFSVVKFKRFFLLKNSVNEQKWSDLKDKYKGERVFVLGNGPSLNETPLFLLKEEYKICFNHFYLMLPRLGWKPDFFMVADDMVIKDMPDFFKKNLLPEVKYGFFPDIHPNNTDFRKYMPELDNVLWMHTDYAGFRSDLPKCGINNTVVNASLQVMAHLGFSEIYVLGVDASYSFKAHKSKNLTNRDIESDGDDPNHFDPRYFGKGKKYHHQPMDEMARRIGMARVFLEREGVQIINAGVGGKLDVLDRKPLREVLSYSEEKEVLIFENLVKHYISDFKYNTAEFVQEVSDMTIEKDYFVINQDSGKKYITKLINTHLALGPHNNSYVFVKQ
jgi:hypothetical protein